MSEVKFGIILSLIVGVLAANGNFLGRISNLWVSPYQNSPPPPPPDEGVGSSSFGGSARGGGGFSGKSFSSRGGYHDYGGPGGGPGGGGGGGGGGPGGPPDSYMSGSHQRGWGGGWGGWDNDHQNLDLYSLLGGLSFASLLGATIIYLARRNTSGRRRRSADGLSYLEDDETDFSEDPQTKGLNIVELIDTFLDNPGVFSGISEVGLGGIGNETSRRSEDISNSNDDISNVSLKSYYPKSSKSKSSNKVHLGPGVVPHSLHMSNDPHHHYEKPVH